MTPTQDNRPTAGIVFILIGMSAISMNDVLIKQLSGDYPLHQIVFTRSLIGLAFGLVVLHFEGGWSLLRTDRPWLHLLRCGLVVVSNMTYFVALAALPLAEATALFFAAPFFITLLSIPVLGERVGLLRMGAVLVGFAGVMIMQRPWNSSDDLSVSRLVLLLPVLAALSYALMQLLTRKLGVNSKASALTIYIQVTFILVSAGFWLVAGDGRWTDENAGPSLQFLLRAWVWPDTQDWPLMIGLGMSSAVVGYCLSQAYRSADAATIAPFEYIGLPLAVLWGWALWSDLPEPEVWFGMTLIVGGGLFVFLRERQKSRRVATIGIKHRY